MRKVYQQEKDVSGLPVAIIASVGFTALLFGFIPFAHRVNKPERTLELRKTVTADLPPPVEESPPATVEEMRPPEAAPAEPQLAETPQQVPLVADLEVATGSGGVWAGFGNVRSITAHESMREEAFEVADLEKRPEPISQVAPAYPAELRRAKIEGVVTLAFLLDETGRVADPRVENSTRPEFEQPALEAIRKWRFRPGMKDGQAVRTYVRIPIRFRVASR